MSKKTTSQQIAGSRHREAPFLLERERYLRTCADPGATLGALAVKRNELIWIARFLPATAPQGVDIGQLHEIVRQRTLIHTGVTMGERTNVIARPWLRFLGWWREPTKVLPFQEDLDSYIKWMRDERGFSPSTIGQWQGRVTQFLQWCAETERDLKKLRPSDIDAHFIQNADDGGGYR